MDSSSIAGFQQKLLDKGQMEMQRKQAAHAVDLHLGNDHASWVQGSSGSTTSPTFNSRDSSNTSQPVTSPTTREPFEVQQGHAFRLSLSSQATQPSLSKAPFVPVTANRVEPTLSDVPTAVPTSNVQQNTGASWVAQFTRLREEIEVRHYSPKTLKTYAHWLKQFQAFTRSKSSDALTVSDVKEFLTLLAVKKGVSASTQNQAFNSLLFLYRHVLQIVKIVSSRCFLILPRGTGVRYFQLFLTEEGEQPEEQRIELLPNFKLVLPRRHLRDMIKA